MSKFSRTLKKLRIEGEYTQKQLADLMGVSESTIGMYERGQREPNFEMLEIIADIFNVYMSDLIEEKPVIALEADDTVRIRFLGDVAAHFGGIANEEHETLEVPASWIRGNRPDDYFAVRVYGSSMYPEYRDGDEVLCRFCDDMGRSGQVGVFMCPDDEATLKRINYVYGEDWVELEPINPEYEPRRIEGYELEQYRVVGKAVRLIRTIGK